MPIDLNDPRDTPTRTPGDFRRTKTGAPMVVDPSGATVKSGPNKGQPKTLTYGRASSAGSLIEDTYNLQKWAERRVALGLSIHLHQRDQYARAADDMLDLLALEVDSPEWKEAADKIVVRAKEAALTSLAADRGTHVHALTEDHDAGAVWLTRAQAGEDLGIGVAAQAALVDAWKRMLDECGFEVLASEARVVHDGWRLAGTLDRVVRLTRDLVIQPDKPNGLYFLPAGTVLVLDIKTGGMKIDYWHKYAPQLAAYAAAVPYDPETDARGEWPFAIDQDVALIAHIPVADILATGRCDISLVPVDLAAGRHAAELCVAAKAWNARRDIFGTPVPVVTAQVAPPVVDGDPFDGINGEATTKGHKDASRRNVPVDRETQADATGRAERGNVVASGEVRPDEPLPVSGVQGVARREQPSEAATQEVVTTGVDKHGIVAVDVTRRRVLVDRATVLKATHADAAKWVAARWPQGVPALKGDTPLTDADLDAIDAVLTAAEAQYAAPFGEHDMTRPTPAAKPVDAPERATWQRPEEGPTIHDDDVTELRASIKRLPGTASARVQAWLGQAIAAGRSVLPADKAHTLRSVSIVQAMANCALVDDFTGDEEFLRVVLAATLGTDAAMFTGVSVGACFGTLTIAEAHRLHAVAERYAERRVYIGFDEAGAPCLAGDLGGLAVAA